MQLKKISVMHCSQKPINTATLPPIFQIIGASPGPSSSGTKAGGNAATNQQTQTNLKKIQQNLNVISGEVAKAEAAAPTPAPTAMTVSVTPASTGTTGSNTHSEGYMR